VLRHIPSRERGISSRRLFGRLGTAALLLGLFAAVSGCKKRTPPAPEKVTAATSASPASSAKAPTPTPPAPKVPLRPVGPRQIVLPGQGITAIRFGATVETIERHMQEPCEVKTESRCLYVKQAVDFSLDKGVLVRAKVHLRDRPVPGLADRTFGIFYGGMVPDILLGLHRHIVHEEFGKPERSETVGDGNAPGLVARDFYPGVTLEYDKLANGNTVLAAMEVFPAPTAGTGGASGKAPSSSKKP